LRRTRWPDGKPACPRCGETESVYTLKAKPFHYVCRSGKLTVTNEGWKETTCHRRNGYRFSVLTGTIFENTNYPLSIWFEVIYLMTQSKRASALSKSIARLGQATTARLGICACGFEARWKIPTAAHHPCWRMYLPTLLK
jgi:hypothetical protein